MGGALFLGNTLLTAPGPLDKTKNIVIPRGAGPATMAKVLQEEGVIAHRAAVPRRADDRSRRPSRSRRASTRSRRISPCRRWSSSCSRASVVQRRLTVPEGMTTAEVVELVRKTEALAGEITLDLKEGDLLPETYFYSRDDTRDGRAAAHEGGDGQDAGRGLAQSAPPACRWPIVARRWCSPRSIEKETAVPAERAKVAAVFINRLRRRMKLESDPTTIYGLTGGKAPLNRELTRADLQSTSPYNTYMVAGLPPGPICNPGRASIVAATNPAPRDRSLYFVADGQGGHAFAANAARAQPQCRALAQIQRERQRASSSSGAGRRGIARAGAGAHGAGLTTRREPCRSLLWRSSCWRSSPSASPGSCAPIRRRWRACCGSVLVVLGGIGTGGLLIFGAAVPARPAAGAVRPGRHR